LIVFKKLRRKIFRKKTVAAVVAVTPVGGLLVDLLVRLGLPEGAAAPVGAGIEAMATWLLGG